MFSLFESYSDAADWKRAESVFPDAAQRLTAGDAPEWYSKIAILAAKAGDRDDAMRIWSRVANLDLSATGALDQLANAGLRDELIAFYHEARKAIPLSEIPAQALAILKKQDADKTDAGDGR